MSKYKAANFLGSMKFAIRGILLSFKSQKNFKIECFIAVVVMLLAYYLDFTRVEAALLLLTIAFMLFAEMINTVVEFTVDAYFGNKYSILAKMAKDISAGAVFMVAGITAIIGGLLFLPKILVLFKHIL